MMLRTIRYVVMFALLATVLYGCQSKKTSEHVDGEEEKHTVQYIEGWQEEYLVRTEDSLASSLLTALHFYGYADATISEPLFVAPFSLYGVSYLPLLEELKQQYGLQSTVVDGSFELAVEEVKANRPLISMRFIRNISTDFLLIVGYETATSELVGFSYIGKEPVRVSKSKWEQDFVEEGLRWSIVFSTDQGRLRSLQENSVSYWLQRGVEFVHKKQYDALANVIQQFDRLDIRLAPANNMRDYYYLIQRHEVPQEVDDHTNLLYEVAPDFSFSIEYMFWKHWIREERELALEYLVRMEKLNLFRENHSETLQLFRGIYLDQGNTEQVEKIETILQARGEE